jgi:cytochrome c peroxidase
MNPFTLKRLQAVTLGSFMMLAAVGCGNEATPDEQPVVEDPQVEETWDAEQHATAASTAQGAYLFTKETFNGNGRTCATCHTLTSGGLSPAQVQAAWSRNRNDPLFRAIDSDDGSGSSYNQLRNNATVTVDIALPANIRLAANPTARTVKLRRAVPTVFDAARFDTQIMFDTREPSLASQAGHAIQGHAQARRTPTSSELNAIVDFERNLFSSQEMANYAATGRAPAVPTGKTDSEKRGAAFFAATGLCGSCHFGALYNTNTANNPLGVPAGTQFGTSIVSEVNFAGTASKEYIVTNPDGTETRVTTPDPGMMLVTGNAQHANLFKMTSLRKLSQTAPFFHDNSAKDMAGIIRQYDAVLTAFGIPHTAQDLTDMANFMKLL